MFGTAGLGGGGGGGGGGFPGYGRGANGGSGVVILKVNASAIPVGTYQID
jgi:hypothetical protein